MANFALNHIKQDAALLYEAGFFQPGSADLAEAALKQTLIELRPQMVGLAELIPDGNYPTLIGNKYGDIYEAQFKNAKTTRLNDYSPVDFYKNHMKPTMDIGKKVMMAKL